MESLSLEFLTRICHLLQRLDCRVCQTESMFQSFADNLFSSYDDGYFDRLFDVFRGALLRRYEKDSGN